jgi:hypothetical protein
MQPDHIYLSEKLSLPIRQPRAAIQLRRRHDRRAAAGEGNRVMCKHESKDFEVIRCKCGIPRKVFAGVGGLDEIREYLESGARVTVDIESDNPSHWRFMDLEDIAQLCGVSLATVERWCEEGMPFQRWACDLPAIIQWLRQGPWKADAPL